MKYLAAIFFQIHFGFLGEKIHIFQLTPITHLAPFGGFINHLGVLKPEIYLVVENIQFTKKEKQCNNLLGFFFKSLHTGLWRQIEISATQIILPIFLFIQIL